MWKIIGLILVVLGCIWLFQHQDTLLQQAENFMKGEKTISKVNGASNEKQKMILDAQKKALEY